MTNHDLTPEERERMEQAISDGRIWLPAAAPGDPARALALGYFESGYRAALDSRQAEEWVTLDQHARVIEAMSDEELRRKEAEAEVERLRGQLEDCEEALADGRVDHENWMERMVTPLADHERVSTGAIQSMAWDDLLAVAVRNLNFGLDLDRELQREREKVERLREAGDG